MGERKRAGRKSWEIFMVHFSNPIAIQGCRKVWQFGGAVVIQGLLKENVFVYFPKKIRGNEDVSLK